MHYFDPISMSWRSSRWGNPLLLPRSSRARLDEVGDQSGERNFFQVILTTGDCGSPHSRIRGRFPGHAHILQHLQMAQVIVGKGHPEPGLFQPRLHLGPLLLRAARVPAGLHLPRFLPDRRRQDRLLQGPVICTNFVMTKRGVAGAQHTRSRHGGEFFLCLHLLHVDRKSVV